MDLIGKVIGSRYRVIEKLSGGSMSSVYRTNDMQDDCSIVLKVIKISSSLQRSDSLIRFHAEIKALSAIDHPNIIKITDHGSFKTGDNISGLYIAFEYKDLQPLSDLLKNKTQLSFDTTLRIIINICNALQTVHETGIIHGDIKPSNIILDADFPDNNLKVIDFGLARLPGYNCDMVSGTFLYMPPEQAGLLKLPVDERSDLYSLGVLFYQLLTGELPFFSDSLITLLHEQLSQLPLPPSKIVKTLPAITDSIILKLLDKEPDNRYQSAAGLKHDLEKILSGNHIFIPGEQDIPQRISANTLFIGREAELGRLFSLCDREEGEIICISGEAGIGKSRLVERFCRFAVSRDILFLEGRCYNRTDNAPYAVLHDVLTGFAGIYFRYTDKKQEKISSILRKDLGGLGNILADFNPLLKPILGDFPDIVGFDPETEKRRLYLVINRFFCSIAEAEGMLIISMEDIHRIDAGTMEFLLEIAASIKTSRIKILLTFRQEELMNRPQTGSLAGKLLNNMLPGSMICLTSFNEKEISAFMPRFISNPEEREKLAGYVFQKSRGNPLFAGEIIKYLIKNEVFKKLDSGWHTDMECLYASTIPDSIAETVLGRISFLTKDEMDVLSSAAVIGKKFSCAILIQLTKKINKCKFTEDEIILTIDRALNQQIIERSSMAGDEFIFTHDRIHDAFYSRIRSAVKRNYHLLTARIIEEDEENKDKHIFDLAYHYISGGNKDKIIQYALPAAHNARENYAYNDAIHYYEIVREILDEKTAADSDEKRAGLWAECMEGLGMSYARSGDADSALGIFNQLISHVDLPLKKSGIFKEMSRAYFHKGNLSGSEYYVREGLSILGEKLPDTRRKVLFQTIKEMLVFAVSPLVPSALLCSPGGKSAERYKAAITLYEWLNWVYFFGESWKMSRTVFRMLNIARRTGRNSHESALSFYYFGFFCISMGWFKTAEKYLNKSSGLMRKSDDRLGMAQCHGGWSLYYLMSGDFSSSIKSGAESIELLENIGGFVEISKSGQFLLNSYFLQSDYAAAGRLYNKYHKYLNNIFEEMTYSSFAFPILYYIETEEYRAARDLLDKYIPYQENLKTWFLYYTYLTLYGYCLCEEGKITESLEYFEKAEKIKKENYFPDHTHILYQHYAEAMILDCTRRSISGNEKKVYLNKIRKACKRAIRHTKKWNHSYDVALRAYAKYFSLAGRNRKAGHYFKLSLDHSRKINRRYELARTLFEYAVYLKDLGRRDEARDNFISSFIIFDELGIGKYRKSILNILDLSSGENNAVREHIKNEKTRYAIKKSQELLHISDLNDIMNEALSAAMTITGASGSHLFLYDEDKERLIPVMSRVINEGSEHDYSLTIAEKVFSTGRAVTTSSAMEDDDLLDIKSVSTKQLKSVLCVPLRYNELINGVCYLDNPLVRGVFNEDDIELLTLYLSNAALAIENRLLHKKIDSSAKEDGIAASSDQAGKYVEQAIDYINKNLREKLTRETVAKVLDINPDYFGKIFKLSTEKSFREYLNEVRIKSTLEKLVNTNEKIIDIAYDAGFESLRTYYRIFYRFIGETPSSYREKRIKPV